MSQKVRHSKYIVITKDGEKVLPVRHTGSKKTSWTFRFRRFVHNLLPIYITRAMLMIGLIMIINVLGHWGFDEDPKFYPATRISQGPDSYTITFSTPFGQQKSLSLGMVKVEADPWLTAGDFPVVVEVRKCHWVTVKNHVVIRVASMDLIQRASPRGPHRYGHVGQAGLEARNRTSDGGVILR